MATVGSSAVTPSDAGVNAPVLTSGRPDLANMDYLQVGVNDTAREVVLTGKNDGQTPTTIPIKITAQKRVVEAKTADYTVLVGDSGKVFTTVGAAGIVIFALPAAVVGLEYFFRVGAALALKIDPNGSETCALPSTGVQGAAGKQLIADADGESVHLVCDKAGQWTCYGFTGTWTAEA